MMTPTTTAAVFYNSSSPSYYEGSTPISEEKSQLANFLSIVLVVIDVHGIKYLPLQDWIIENPHLL
jgi:hypothetical protein